ncbi:hypothetical protein [Kutzneria buriramensis]|uniref:Phosphate transport system protein n=1 Tax=Kutzneria buriramensis TaxID=1045776 RepID=A0A3E0HF51_9PSEU|nr:hypothetical protein [Kutzneria buriramensis]REH43852.1 phosphate transport system protein [Kutzneria buriramensis]
MRQVSGVELTEVCESVADVIDLATSALVEADLVAAQQVLTATTPAARLAETTAVLVGRCRLAHGELPETIAAVTELERMHDLARHIAEVVHRHVDRPVLSDPLRQRFAAMGEVARRMTLAAACVLYYGDRGYLVAVSAAASEMHRFLVLADRHDAALVGQFYEQYADHAVHLAMHFAGAGADRNPLATADRFSR